MELKIGDIIFVQKYPAMRFSILTVFFAILTVLSLRAQDESQFHPCGTTEEKVKWLDDYQQNPAAFPDNGDTIYVPLTIHLVGKSNGTGFISEKTVLESLCTLNEDFRPSAIQFFIEGQLKYISNSNYYEHNFNQGEAMMINHRVPNTINCYIVADPAGNCGYSSYNLGIALAIGCTQPQDHTWAHEIGHFLSLPHPFYGWEGYEHDYDLPAPNQIGNRLVERVDGQNCNTAGDGFCDTPPDYLNYIWSCEDGLSNTIQKDPTGATFQSDGSLFMSYAGSGALCEERFSDQQIAAMRANLYFEKQSYLYDQTPDPFVTATVFAPLSPQDGAQLPGYQEIVFSWEPVPNATGYLFDISLVPNFAFVLERQLVYSPSATSEELPPNRDLYWRVKPFNDWHTCSEYLPGLSFRTGTISAVRDLALGGRIAVAPNPAEAGIALQATFDFPAPLQLEAALLTLSGQTVSTFRWDLPAGRQTRELSTAALAPGMYLLRIQTDKGLWSQKVIIQR